MSAQDEKRIVFPRGFHYAFPMEQLMNIPRPARTALSVLNRAGYEAWLVGGFVRDSLRGIPAHDVDIATNAHWRFTKEAFQKNGFTVHETGTKHGTVTVMVDGWPLEITTFREEGAYSDARHPDSVAFVQDVETDLARRDFTMNAIAYHPENGFKDPFGGRQDIQNHLIKCVGKPSKRFAEDALRIMRAARFCSQLGFSIHPQTREGMAQCVSGLDHVARERIQDELGRLLMGPHVADALPQAEPVLLQILPQLNEASVLGENPNQAIRRMAKAVAHAPQSLSVRYAALFLGAATPFALPFMKEALQSLRIKKEIVRQALLLVELFQEGLLPDAQEIHALCVRAEGNPETLRVLFDLHRAIELAQDEPREERLRLVAQCHATLNALEKEGAPFSVRQLALTGRDLIQAGMPAGSGIGEALQSLLDACVRCEVKNSRADLLIYLGFLDFRK